MTISPASGQGQGSGNPWVVAAVVAGGDGKERLQVLQSEPSPLGIQPGGRERALDPESQAPVLPCLTCGLGRGA